MTISIKNHLIKSILALAIALPLMASTGVEEAKADRRKAAAIAGAIIGGAIIYNELRRHRDGRYYVYDRRYGQPRYYQPRRHHYQPRRHRYQHRHHRFCHRHGHQGRHCHYR